MEYGSFTTDKMLWELACSAPAHLLTRGDPGEVREFTAVATTDGIPLDLSLFEAFISSAHKISISSSDEAARHTRWVVKGKIVGDKNGVPFDRLSHNCHSFLSSCKLSTKNARQAAILATHTHFITGKDFNMAGEMIINKGGIRMIYEPVFLRSTGKTLSTVKKHPATFAIK